MRKMLPVCVTLGVLLGISARAEAVGVLFSRPLWSSQTYQKMWIKTVDVRTQIDGQIAATHVDEVFFNEMNQRVEAIFVFPLPENAVITDLYYWFNGVRYKAEIRERRQAVEDYNKKLRQHLDPALLEYLGNNLFRLRIAPINPRSEVRFEITYTELLPYEFGKVRYKFLLRATGLSPKPLERVSLRLDARSATSFKFFECPSHGQSTALQITRLSENHYQVVFGDEHFTPDRDFLLQFETRRQDVDIRLLTYKPAETDSFGEDAFYALWITPPDSIGKNESIPLQIVFVADVSSSMEGTRLEQLKEALDGFLDRLGSRDAFNLISFGTAVVPFADNLVPATSENLEEARRFVHQLSALGLTNIDLALQTALQQSFSDSTLNMIVFVTDGYPTFGEMNTGRIAENAAGWNSHHVRIFPFGVGEDVSRALLTLLARKNGGYATFISRDDSIAAVVDNHFRRMIRPVLTDLEIDIPSFGGWDRYPRRLPDLFWGSQVLQFGRYPSGGRYDIHLRAKLKGEPVEFVASADFPDTLGGSRFVPRLWAREKINDLLEQIEIYGEQDELVDQIIDLSVRYGVLTRYTALYSDPTSGNPGGNPSTGVAEGSAPKIPEGFVLKQNYPNPFNSETEITYILPAGQESYFVRLEVYDLRGRRIRILVHKEQRPGIHSVVWNGRNSAGEMVPSGIYIFRLQVAGRILTRKMLYVR